MEELAAAYQSAGEQVYVVRNGATTGRGALGYTAAVVEMKRQCEDLGIGRMTIFAPGGNGGVAAGLIYGNQLMGQPFCIVIVSVEDDRETLTAHIRSTISEAVEITGLPHERACGTGGGDHRRLPWRRLGRKHRGKPAGGPVLCPQRGDLH